MENVTSSEIFATLCFTFAILHTFSVKQFKQIAHKYPEGSVGENFFHLLGEVEVVFGIWAAFFLIFDTFQSGTVKTIDYLQTRNFTEPIFVFVIMTIASSRPILGLAEKAIEYFSRLIPLKKPIAFYITCLTIGPLMGSFITEPAAMTVIALILLDSFYQRGISQKFMYATLGLLFVNISIGGTLTPFAAPPVLMVAQKWNWNLSFMLSNFGLKAAVAIVISTLLVVYRFRNELSELNWEKQSTKQHSVIPFWVSITHLLFLVAIVMSAHYLNLFFGIFLFFLGLVTVTKEYQEELKLKEGLLVAFFLGGLVVLGGPQKWWLEIIFTHLTALPLFLGSIMLTAITDNAALTYLGSLVPTLTEHSRYALVAGAVTGGGLTVIANAPNPAGFSILNKSFGEEEINPFLLFTNALVPTLIAGVCFWFL